MILEIPSDRQQNRIAFNFIKKTIFENKNRKLLDVGSADNLLKKFIPKNIKYYSLDVDRINGEHDFIIDLDKQKIPVKNKYFDIILCLDTLEHTMFPQKIIDELKRVTKDDAIFVISLPNEYNFLQRIYYLLGIKKQTEIPWRIVELHQHIQKPRVKDILKLMSDNFIIEKIRYHWESRASENSKMFRYMDRIIDLLIVFSPSLFSRDVVILGHKKIN
jgi:SAM-dependent methyltransferase